MSKRTTGTVKWFNDSKGYGFAACEGLDDVFLHYTAIVGEGFKTLQEGQRISFELMDTPKGPTATSIKKES